MRALSKHSLADTSIAAWVMGAYSQVAPMLGLPDWASKGGIVNIVRPL